MIFLRPGRDTRGENTGKIKWVNEARAGNEVRTQEKEQARSNEKQGRAQARSKEDHAEQAGDLARRGPYIGGRDLAVEHEPQQDHDRAICAIGGPSAQSICGDSVAAPEVASTA